ncbi:MAG: hypothetical protein ACI8WB_000913 [Phenylobacterium sp.]|jgi:hypothetical protein
MADKGFRPDKQNLIRLWLEIAELDSKSLRLQLIESKIGDEWVKKTTENGVLVKYASDIIDIHTLNPGPSTRYALICEILIQQDGWNRKNGKGLKKFVLTDLAKCAFELGNDPVDTTYGRMKNAATWHKKRSMVEFNPFILKALSTKLNSQIRNKKGLVPLDTIELFTKRFESVNAITDFFEWIHGTPQQTLKSDGYQTHLVLDTWLDNRKRKNCFKAIKEVILEKKRQLSIINLHCAEQSIGLTTVVTTLKEMLENGTAVFSLPICYISLSKNPGQDKSVDLPSIINEIRAFYFAQPVDKSKPPATSAEVESFVLDIRRAMLKHPALIVFDGFECLSQSLPALGNAIKDDDVIWLLNRLMEPLINANINESQWDIFNKTKFLITSDSPIKSMKDLKVIDTDNAVLKSIEWPRPTDKKLWDNIILLLPLGNISWIKHVHQHIPGIAKLGSENLTFIFDCCYRLASINISYKNSILDQLLNDLKETYEGHKAEPLLIESLKKCTINWIWNNLTNHKVWRFFWLFLAISTSGLRQFTFRELFKEWSFLLPDNSDFPGVQECTDCDLMIELGKFEDTFKGMISRIRRDFVFGYDDAEHPFEVARPPSSFHRKKITKDNSCSIDISLPEVKSIFIDLFIHRYSYGICRFAHQLIAEECIHQQTIVFRHTSEDNLASLRGYRRQLETLYHGYLSLPAGSEMANDVLLKDPFSVIGGDPARTWKYLTIFGYIRIMERQDFRLSRSFGADELKLEILKLARKPAEFRETNLARQNIQSLAQFEFSPPESPLINKLKVSIAQAAYIVGKGKEELEVDCLVELGDTKEPSNLDPERTEKLLNLKAHLFKRNIDIMMSSVNHGDSDDNFREQYEIILQLCKERLQRLYPENIESKIQLQLKVLEQVFEQHNFNPSITVQEIAANISNQSYSPSAVAKTLIPIIKEEKGSEVVDLLSRLAESIACEAELKFLNHAKEPKEKQRYIKKVLLAFAYLCQAEALRLQLVVSQPKIKFDAVSGHCARLMIRIALRLETLSKRHHSVVNTGYFGRKARRMADVLCRHLFAYPRERASMLIIESSFARLLNSDKHKLDALKLSLSFLDTAEPIVESLDLKAHVRKRFRLERSKVFTNIAIEYEKLNDMRKRNFYLKLAKYDADTCSNLASVQDQMMWWKLADFQSSSVDEIIELTKE